MSSTRRSQVGIALVAAAAIGGAALFSLGEPRSAVGQSGQTPPNVVVIMSDDQTQDSIRFMPQTLARIGAPGATFPNSFVNYPLCCPSRSTLLTGQYAHNHGVLSNMAPDGGFDKLDSTNTLPVWLQSAGYYTGLIGKYLNGYEGHRNDVPPLVPPGYSEWQGSTITYTFYDYELNENGVLVPYGSAPEQYSSDVYTAKAVDFIGRRAPSNQPFFLWLSYLAPHAGGPNPNPNPPTSGCGQTAKPAPRHAGAFAGEALPLPPSFNEADVSDKPAVIRNSPPLSAGDVAEITRNYRCRLGSLLALDDGVSAVIDALAASGELDNTLVVYTADNGFFHGEHRTVEGKVKLYEPSIRVPLMVRGPGIPPGVTVPELAVNADLAATILDATGASAGRRIDGRSLIPFAATPSREHGRELLIETNTYRAIRTQRYLYAEHFGGPSAGAKELYDLRWDPYELTSLHNNPTYAAVGGALAQRLFQLAGCNGPNCKTGPALRLDLRIRRPRGRRCARHPVIASAGGADLGLVQKAELFVNGRGAGTDRARPFRRTVPFGRLRQRARSLVRMRLSLIDGRRITVDHPVRACR